MSACVSLLVMGGVGGAGGETEKRGHCSFLPFELYTAICRFDCFLFSFSLFHACVCCKLLHTVKLLHESHP